MEIIWQIFVAYYVVAAAAAFVFSVRQYYTRGAVTVGNVFELLTMVPFYPTFLLMWMAAAVSDKFDDTAFASRVLIRNRRWRRGR